MNYQTTLIKDGERYVIRGDLNNPAALSEAFYKKAKDPESPLDEFDAVALTISMESRIAQTTLANNYL